MRMRTIPRIAGVCALAAALGCGARLPPEADAQQAREVLRTSLDAWKNGESPESLQKRSPAIYVRDADWKDGWKLTMYRTTLDDEPHGQQRRMYVHLALQNREGKATAKEVQYLIDTSPARVIVRMED